MCVALGTATLSPSCPAGVDPSTTHRSRDGHLSVHQPAPDPGLSITGVVQTHLSD